MQKGLRSVFERLGRRACMCMCAYVYVCVRVRAREHEMSTAGCKRLILRAKRA